jgi:hypothetical protein
MHICTLAKSDPALLACLQIATLQPVFRYPKASYKDPFRDIVRLLRMPLKCLNFFGSTRDVAEVDFAITVGFFRYESDVDTIATAFSTAEVFLSLCCRLHML